MWQSQIVVGEKYIGHRTYIEHKLSQISKLNFVTKTYKRRIIIYLSAENHVADAVKRQVEEALASFILVKIKLAYFLEAINPGKITPLICALLSCLIHFESLHEKKYIHNILSEQQSYSIDGILYFKMSKLKSGWAELSKLSKGLLSVSMDDEEILNLIVFILSNCSVRQQCIFLTGTEGAHILTNLSKGNVIPIDPLYDNPDFNLINAIMQQAPTELVVDEPNSGHTVVELYRKIIKVRVL